MNDKIKKYHFDEIILILLILTTDLSKYDEDKISSFNENIEGRIEALFTKHFLIYLPHKFGITDQMILEFEKLRDLVVNLYEARWMEKLKGWDPEVKVIRIKAKQVLDALKIKETDPRKFVDEHFDW